MVAGGCPQHGLRAVFLVKYQIILEYAHKTCYFTLKVLPNG